VKAVNEVDLLAKNSFALLQLTIEDTSEVVCAIFKYPDIFFKLLYI
jgi:hypothetical protein